MRFARLEGEVVLCHSLSAGPLAPVLDEIGAFVAAYPHELVVVDVQHCYCFDTTDYAVVVALIRERLGDRVVEAVDKLSPTSPVHDFWARKVDYAPFG